MSSVNLSFRGLMAPVFTPFDQNKNVNFQIIPHYAKYLYFRSVQGILGKRRNVVNGTTGEGVSQTFQERKDVLRAWTEACQPYGLTIMAQVGGTNMQDVKALARHAEELGVSSILCLPDLFFRPSTVDDLVMYLKIVSDEAPKTPLLYYHIPSFNGINLNMRELIDKSSEIPTFAGIKFTDNDLVMGSSCVPTGNNNKHAVFLGCDALLLPALLLGFDSAIGTTINMFPTHNINILRYFKRGEIDKAMSEQKNLNHNISQITKYGSWVSSMKSAMKLITGIDLGPVRDPLLEVDGKTMKLDIR